MVCVFTNRLSRNTNAMPGENHLTYFKVQNFKRFKELEVKDIGQFNLVLGDNNVGKTSFLEALLFDENPAAFFFNLSRAFQYRKIGRKVEGGVLKQFVKREALLSGEYYLRIEGRKKDHPLYIEFTSENSQQWVQSSKINPEPYSDIYEISKPSDTQIPFIPFSQGFADDLVTNYSSFIQKDRVLKRKLISSLKVLLPSFEDFEINSTWYDRPTLIFYQNSTDAALPLGFLGEGTIKLFRILVDIVNFSGQRLMIDEIDTGIHYSRMKDFWRTILLAAKQNDVQLFATTHNLECIRYFKEALEELPDLQQKARTIKLVEHLQTKEVFAQTHQFGVLEKELAIGNEVR